MTREKKQENKVRRTVYILSVSQTRTVAQQHSIIDVAIASISGQTIDPWEAAAMLAGQLSMKSTASRLGASWRPEEHIVHEPEGG